MESRILPEVSALLSAAGLISIFSVSTLGAEERDRAEARVGRQRFFAFDPENLPASDEQAANQICSALESQEILIRSRFGEGEGIQEQPWRKS